MERKRPQAFRHLGVEVRPVYKSKSGTGRECNTVQGWVYTTALGIEKWNPSMRSACDEIDRMFMLTGMQVSELLAMKTVNDAYLRNVAATWPDVSGNIRAYFVERDRIQSEMAERKKRLADHKIRSWMADYDSASEEERIAKVASLLDLDD